MPPGARPRGAHAHETSTGAAAAVVHAALCTSSRPLAPRGFGLRVISAPCAETRLNLKVRDVCRERLTLSPSAAAHVRLRRTPRPHDFVCPRAGVVVGSRRVTKGRRHPRVGVGPHYARRCHQHTKEHLLLLGVGTVIQSHLSQGRVPPRAVVVGVRYRGERAHHAASQAPSIRVHEHEYPLGCISAQHSDGHCKVAGGRLACTADANHHPVWLHLVHARTRPPIHDWCVAGTSRFFHHGRRANSAWSRDSRPSRRETVDRRFVLAPQTHKSPPRSPGRSVGPTSQATPLDPACCETAAHVGSARASAL